VCVGRERSQWFDGVGDDAVDVVDVVDEDAVVDAVVVDAVVVDVVLGDDTVVRDDDDGIVQDALDAVVDVVVCVIGRGFVCGRGVCGGFLEM
jgi:hypothetical protein